MMTSIPEDERNDIFLSCRYGDLEEIEQFVRKYGKEALPGLRDDNGSTVLHMVCANGHLDALQYLLTIVPSSILSAQNNALSTPLHWAALNHHLPIMQKLVEFPDGPGINLIDIKNAAGRSPLAEAEMAAFNEGAKWLVEKMRLEGQEGVKEHEEIVGGGIDFPDTAGRDPPNPE